MRYIIKRYLTEMHILYYVGCVKALPVDEWQDLPPWKLGQFIVIF